MKLNKLLVLYFIISSLNFLKVLTFKTNFDDLNRYLDEEKPIIDLFDEYLSSEENRINRLRQTYEHFRQQNSIALNDKQLFLSHPNDVYFLIKRISIEWKTVEDLLKPNKRTKYNLISKLNFDPSKFNFTDAVESYEKLIYYYELSITSAANGFIEYKTSSGDQKVFKSLSNQSFDAFDCYLIGKQSFNNTDYYSSVLWFEEALKTTDHYSRTDLMENIFEFISVSKNFEISTEVLDLLQELSDYSLIAKFMFDHFDTMNKNSKNNHAELENVELVNRDLGNDLVLNQTIDQDLLDNNDYLCNGRKLLNISYESKLKCFYLNTTLRPYLRLTRVKVEELYKRPQIVLIHNFLSEIEVQTLKNISKHVLTPTKVLNKTGHSVFNFETRITYHHFIINHSLVKTIDRRILEITGLNSEISDDRMKVVKYNLNGVFNIHKDSPSDPANKAHGRIAAWITFLADEVVGGATVFPKYNVSVFPQKYSALLWYHLLSSGDVDHDMWHTGCPVLYGQKWITVKHMGTKGQPYDKCSPNRYAPRSLQEI